MRRRSTPSKYNIYWDAGIPMEYYEEEFLEFEEYAKITGLKQMGTCESNENTPDFMLAKIAKYEKWMKAEHRREWKKFLKSKQKGSKLSRRKRNLLHRMMRPNHFR